MINTVHVHPVFREGDEVVLTRGIYEGTPGVFLRLKRTSTGPTSPSGMAAFGAIPWHGSLILSSQSMARRTDAGTDMQPIKEASQMDGRTGRAIEEWEGEGGAAGGRAAHTSRRISEGRSPHSGGPPR